MTNPTAPETHRPQSPAGPAARPRATVFGHPLWFCLFCAGMLVFLIGFAGGILVAGGHRSRPEPAAQPAGAGVVAELLPANSKLMRANDLAELAHEANFCAEARGYSALRAGQSFVLDRTLALAGRSTPEGWVAAGLPLIACPPGSRVTVLDVMPNDPILSLQPVHDLSVHVLVVFPGERTPKLGWMPASKLEQQVLRSSR